MGYLLEWQGLEPSDQIGHDQAGSVVSVVVATWPTIGGVCFDDGIDPALG